MSGSYAVGNNYLAFTAGSCGAAGTGAFTIAALVQPGVGNNNAGFYGLYASTTNVRSIGEAGNGLYGSNDFSPSGYGTLTQGTWYVVACTKSASTVPWRMHYWAWNSGGTGAFSHGVATSAANQGNGSTITQQRIGAMGINANGLIAAAGVWTTELSDAQIDTLISANLSAWSALSPAELISLENWNGSSGATVPVGTSSFSAVTGTVSSGANPSGFNFSLGGGGASPSGLAVPLALGAPTAALGLTAAPSGLALPISFGTPAVALQSAAPAGLAVPLALGAPAAVLNLAAAPAGLAVQLAFGQPLVTAGAFPAGLALPIAFGQPAVAGQGASPAGLAVPLALGQPAAAVGRTAVPAGLALPLNFGMPVVGAQSPYSTAVLVPGATAAAVLTPGGYVGS